MLSLFQIFGRFVEVNEVEVTGLPFLLDISEVHFLRLIIKLKSFLVVLFFFILKILLRFLKLFYVHSLLGDNNVAWSDVTVNVTNIVNLLYCFHKLDPNF